HVALSQEDPETATRYLGDLVQRGISPVRARIELAYRLIELDRVVSAAPHIQVLLANDQLDPVEQMQTAQLLRFAGRSAEAFLLGYKAFQRAPASAEMHRAFIALGLMSDAEMPVAEAVTAGTFVRLGAPDGSTRHYTVRGEEPINRLQGDLSVAEAE